MNNEQIPSHGKNEPDDYEVFGTSESARREIEASVSAYLTLSNDDTFDAETVAFRKRLRDFVGSSLDGGLRQHLFHKNADGTYGGSIREHTPTENPRIAVLSIYGKQY
jgi:hypothetical protein